MTETRTTPAPVRTDRDLRFATIASVAGVAALTMAVYHLVVPGPPEATFGSLEDWFRDLVFLTYLCATIAALGVARVRGLAPAASVGLVGCGYGLVAVGVVAGLVLQEDPSWFFVLAGPGLLLSAAGFVVWAVVGTRRRMLPWWAAVWCALGALVAILGAEAGLSAVIGTFWLWCASRAARPAKAPSAT